MITGLFFILAGILIAVYPQILVIFISGFFILIGAGIMMMSLQFRRLHRKANTRLMDWVFRY